MFQGKRRGEPTADMIAKGEKGEGSLLSLSLLQRKRKSRWVQEVQSLSLLFFLFPALRPYAKGKGGGRRRSGEREGERVGGE